MVVYTTIKTIIGEVVDRSACPASMASERGEGFDASPYNRKGCTVAMSELSIGVARCAECGASRHGRCPKVCKIGTPGCNMFNK